MPLPAIIAGVMGVAQLVSKGIDLVESITGERPKDETSKGLETAYEQMTPDQRVSWNEKMTAEIKMFEAENDRIKNEQGEITPGILTLIGQKAAAHLVMMRMETRPWCARWAMRVVLLPFFVTVYDMVVRAVNNLLLIFGIKRELVYMGDMFFNEKSLYREMYDLAVEPCVAIVLGYMLVRHFQQQRKAGAASMVDQIGETIGKVVGVFKKK